MVARRQEAAVRRALPLRLCGPVAVVLDGFRQADQANPSRFRGPRTGPDAITLHGWDWAPNGRRVVFAASKGPAAARLYTISIDGRHRRAVRRRGSAPEWSSDGRYILFSPPDPEPFPPFGSG